MAPEVESRPLSASIEVAAPPEPDAIPPVPPVPSAVDEVLHDISEMVPMSTSDDRCRVMSVLSGRRDCE